MLILKIYVARAYHIEYLRIIYIYIYFIFRFWSLDCAFPSVPRSFREFKSYLLISSDFIRIISSKSILAKILS